MRKVRNEELKPGMVLARSIFDLKGRILVRENTEISESLIRRFQELGLPAAYVRVSPEITDWDFVSPKIRADLVSSLTKLDSEIRLGKPLNIDSIKEQLFELVDEAAANRGKLLRLIDIRFHQDHTSGHSVNVCLIALRIAFELGYNDLKIAELATGGLFHDIGMSKIPLEILLKKEKLNAEELKLIQTHPEVGYRMLREIHGISSVAAHVAYQHHERYDGSGYPRGLSGTNIHEYARILAIADVYDAMTTEKLYRKAIAPAWAFKYILTKAGTDFDPEIVKIFTNIVHEK